MQFGSRVADAVRLSGALGNNLVAFYDIHEGESEVVLYFHMPF
jgi:hypothetical protein